MKTIHQLEEYQIENVQQIVGGSIIEENDGI
ncbi:hypothetical protein KORDIASMS9_00838 [Kordia sp. SMS9]|nr:hypothetical protein KORDIASMS9_00838 [Kordia sp. SMS9]